LKNAGAFLFVRTRRQTDKKIIKNNRQNILHYRKRLHYLCADKKTTDKTDKTGKTKQTDNDSDNADRQ